MIPEVTQPRKSVGRDLNLYSLLPSWCRTG